MFVAHALLKYFVFTLPGTAQFFESLGLPGALGYVTFAAELVGGVLLIAGVHVRIVSLVLVPFSSAPRGRMRVTGGSSARRKADGNTRRSGP